MTDCNEKKNTEINVINRPNAGTNCGNDSKSFNRNDGDIVLFSLFNSIKLSCDEISSDLISITVISENSSQLFLQTK